MSTELDFIVEESAEAVFVSVGELSDVDLFGFGFLDYFHVVFDLLVEVVDDAFLLMDRLDLFGGELGAFDEYPRAGVEAVLEVALVVEGDGLFVVVLELLVDAVAIK